MNLIRVLKLKYGGKTEQTESVGSETIPDRENTKLGFQSSDPEPAPPDPDQSSKAEKDGDENLHVKLQKQLDLVEPEDKEEGGSNAWRGEEEVKGFKSVEVDWEDVRNGEENYQDGNGANGNEVQKNNEKSNASNENRRQFPVRPTAEDCAFYMKTGACKFGSNCKFNHPVRRKTQAGKERVKEKEEATEKPSQTECKYYLGAGGCKYGNACRFNHSRANPPVLPAKSPVPPVLEFNFLGLPIRPGEKECPYYMRNGTCKYESNCKFNHPEPTAVGGSDPPLAFDNGGSASIQDSSPSAGSWSSPGPLNELAPCMPIMFSPTQSVPTQSPEWNGYQAPIYPPERSIPPPPVYVTNNTITQTSAYAHQQQQMIVDEFPERPGQPDCGFFVKTGDCKFKSNCRYHHPKNQLSKLPLCPLNDKGLPLRPDQSVCLYYSRYGICKFGPACKFHHPEQPPSATASGDNQTTASANPVVKENSGAAADEDEKEKDAGVPQPL